MAVGTRFEGLTPVLSESSMTGLTTKLRTFAIEEAFVDLVISPLRGAWRLTHRSYFDIQAAKKVPPQQNRGFSQLSLEEDHQ